MGRSSKSAWLEGPGDLREADVEDVPVPGESVRVRALPAGYSNQAQSDATELKQVGNQQIVSINTARLEVLQFAHGVVDPEFTVEEAEAISNRFGPAFKKVIAKIDELSAVDKKAIEAAEARFPGSGNGTPDSGEAGVLEAAAGSGGPAVPARAGVGTGQDGPGANDG